MVGIGGMGMSALARYFFAKGNIVTGSDLRRSETTDDLIKEGIDITIGEASTGNVSDDVTKLVYTPAAKADNPEIMKAKELGIPVSSYPEALGEVTKEYFTIGISGSHGKSTTTSMLALVLIEAGLDPTVIVGTRLKEFYGSNFKEGKSKYLVIKLSPSDCCH